MVLFIYVIAVWIVRSMCLNVLLEFFDGFNIFPFITYLSRVTSVTLDRSKS